jgi:hypothetical protein
MRSGGSDPTWGGKSTLFDHLVQHERGAAVGSARSLRPRLPHPFEKGSAQDTAFELEEVGVNSVSHHYPHESPITERRNAAPKPPTATDPAPDVRRPPRAAIERATGQPPERPRPANEPAGANVTLHERIEMVVTNKSPSAPGGEPAVEPKLRDRGAAPVQAQPLRRQQLAPPSRQLSGSRPKLVVPGAHRPDNSDQIVEIHIGRIDVRAAPKPVDVQPAASASAPPVNHLAAYLQRRSRGARS